MRLFGCLGLKCLIKEKKEGPDRCRDHRSASMGRELVLVFQAFFVSLFWNNTRIVCLRSAPAAGGAPTEGGAPQQPPNLTSNRRLQQTQAQVDEVSVHPILLVK